jgi:hypothetical protein
VRIAPSVAILTASMSKLGDAVVAKALHESTVTKIATSAAHHAMIARQVAS